MRVVLLTLYSGEPVVVPFSHQIHASVVVVVKGNGAAPDPDVGEAVAERGSGAKELQYQALEEEAARRPWLDWRGFDKTPEDILEGRHGFPLSKRRRRHPCRASYR